MTCWEWGQSTPGWWAPSTPGDNSRDSSRNSWDFLPKFPGVSFSSPLGFSPSVLWDFLPEFPGIFSLIFSLGFLPRVLWDFLPDFLPEFLGISCLNSWVFSPEFPAISSLISSLISLGLPPQFPWDSLPEFPGISSSFIPWDFLLELPRNFSIRSLNLFFPPAFGGGKRQIFSFSWWFFLWIE